MNTSCLESFLRCDVYALGLVLWEVCSRAAGAEARAPFADLAPADPSFDDMRKIVCVDQARPLPPNHPHPVCTEPHYFLHLD